MKLTDKNTITSKYEPKSKNVTWVDMSTGSPVMKKFINGIWTPVGGGGCNCDGGGSNLPTPSSENATMVYQVVPTEIAPAPFELVAASTEMTESPWFFSHCDDFTEGTNYRIVLDGVEYTGKVLANEVLDVGTLTYIGFGSFNSDNNQWDYILSQSRLNQGRLKFENNTDTPVSDLQLYLQIGNPTYGYNWQPGVKIPIPTEDDLGKVLVVERAIGSDVEPFIPEQTIIIPAGGTLAEIANADLSKFVAGATVTLQWNYSEVPEEVWTVTGEVISLDGVLGVTFTYELSDMCFIYIYNDKLYFGFTFEDVNDASIILSANYAASVFEYKLKQQQVIPVVKLMNWNSSGGDSILIDVDGNVFHEGTDYDIIYAEVGASDSPFDIIESIDYHGNSQCAMIIIEDIESHKMYTRVPDFCDSNSNANIAFWSINDDSHYIGHSGEM